MYTDKKIYLIENIIQLYKECWTGTLECNYEKGTITFDDKIGYIGTRTQYTKTLMSDLMSEENEKFGWFILSRTSEINISKSFEITQILTKKFVWND